MFKCGNTNRLIIKKSTVLGEVSSCSLEVICGYNSNCALGSDNITIIHTHTNVPSFASVVG